jgi:hypothetical protein
MLSSPEKAAIISAIATLMAALIIIFPQLRSCQKSNSIQESQVQKEPHTVQDTTIKPQDKQTSHPIQGIITSPLDGSPVLGTFNARNNGDGSLGE